MAKLVGMVPTVSGPTVALKEATAEGMVDGEALGLSVADGLGTARPGAEGMSGQPTGDQREGRGNAREPGGMPAAGHTFHGWD